MDHFKFIVEKNQEGIRLDAFIAENIEEATRSFLQKQIEKGHVLVNDVVNPSKKYKVKYGDSILVEIPEPEAIDALPEDIPLDIIYEDGDVVVVNKARGMVVHPAVGNYTGTLVNGLLYHCKNLSGINGAIRPGIVHRIDKDTTGLLMVAKNDVAHASLAEQLKEHSVTRVYEAIVHGTVKLDEGTIDAPIARHRTNRLKMAVDKDGKRAVTHFNVITRFERFTHIEARLETGRTHQIRVHMASIHHPLAGDFVYGPEKKVYGMDTQLLHAKVIGFVHPRTGEYLEFQANLPDEFQNVLKKLSR